MYACVRLYVSVCECVRGDNVLVYTPIYVCAYIHTSTDTPRHLNTWASSQDSVPFVFALVLSFPPARDAPHLSVLSTFLLSAAAKSFFFADVCGMEGAQALYKCQLNQYTVVVTNVVAHDERRDTKNVAPT